MIGFLSLLFVFLKIGAVSYGGGWTVVGVIKTEVLARGWLDERGFSELVGLAQVTPGPVALNAATLVGFKLYGVPGSITASLAVVAAPTVFVLAAGFLMGKLGERGQKRLDESFRTGTFALVALTLWSFAPVAVSSPSSALWAVAAFAVAAFTKWNPLWVILGAGAAEAALSLFAR